MAADTPDPPPRQLARARRSGLDAPNRASLPTRPRLRRSGEVRAPGRADRRLSRAALGRAMLLAALPSPRCSRPFQRDSPPAYEAPRPKIDEAGAFLDPIIVVRGEDGRLWTPNGRHRLAAAKVLGAQADLGAGVADERLRVPHPRVEHREGPQPQGSQPRVIRNGAQPRQRQPRAKENDFAAEFEAPEVPHARISTSRTRSSPARLRAVPEEGGPVLRTHAAASLREREGYAGALRASTSR